jgi:predicted solute-binding protein
MMVFAVWAVRREVAAARTHDVRTATHALRASFDWAQAHRVDVLDAAQRVARRPTGFYDRYYRALEFDFDSRARRGLAHFCRELIANGQLAQMPRFEYFDCGTAQEIPDAIAS